MRWSDFVYGYGNATQEEVRRALTINRDDFCADVAPVEEAPRCPKCGGAAGQVFADEDAQDYYTRCSACAHPYSFR